MSDVKHTSGPWRIEFRHDGFPFGVSSPDTWKHDLDFVCELHRTDTLEELEANARLIASAPELLEALKELNHQMRDVLAYYPVPALCVDAAKKADEAIAKATGGEQS